MQTLTKPAENSDKILRDIRSLLSNDLSAVDLFIRQQLHSTVPLTEEVTQHIFQSGGKRLRPLLLLLTANACNVSAETYSEKHALAAVIEFVHTATLLHDDVVDNSNLRRGKKTANAIWSNQASVLVGDFLYSRAFQILAQQNQPRIMQVLSETTNAIAEGEVRQLMNQHNPDLTEDNYFHVITEKTAKLFSTAAEIGAILSDASSIQQTATATYGLHIGIAFQIIDDLLDYQADSENTGKNVGDDLAEGKVTLPIIYAIQASDNTQADYLRDTLKHGNIHELDNVLKMLHETKSIEKTKKTAIEHTQLAAAALENLPDSAYRDAMKNLLVFAVQRCY